MNYFSHSRVVVNESPILTHIDGFVVTDGDHVRVTLRSQLSREQKRQVLEGLLGYVSDGQPAICMWDAGQYYTGDASDIGTYDA